MRTLKYVGAILMIILLAACESAPVDTGAIAKSDLARELAPAITVSDSQSLLEGNSAFAFDLYRHVLVQDGNLIYSPYSISLAAAMLYGGASGETATQIAKSLHFTLPLDKFHPTFNSLALDLAQRPAQSKKVDRNNPMQLSIANAVWGQRDYAFEQAYLDLLAVNYGAGVRLLDFASEPDLARRQINDWADLETNGKIKEVMPPGSIDPTTRMVLANAIYFKAAWQEAFVKKLTHEAPFSLLDGTQVQVPTMETDGNIPVRFGSGEGYQVVALPYKGNLAEMVIILPDQGEFQSMESSLDAAKFADILQSLEQADLIVYMPKFEFTKDIDLKSTLSALGMPLAFDKNKAEFWGITKSEQIFVQQAFHKAYVLVNEEGTEAAAVTIFGMAPASLPVTTLRIDRAFIFIIRDVPTGTILFVGRVLNPSEK